VENWEIWACILANIAGTDSAEDAADAICGGRSGWSILSVSGRGTIMSSGAETAVDCWDDKDEVASDRCLDLVVFSFGGLLPRALTV
jgi:hypothetical protein